MINIDRQVGHWMKSAREDREVAAELLTAGRVRHSLFMARLAAEKVIKALVCRSTGSTPPAEDPIHLAEEAGFDLDPELLTLFSEMNDFSRDLIDAGMPVPPPSPREAEIYLQRIDRLFAWIDGHLAE